MDKKLQIPFAVDLTEERGWNQQDKHLYFIFRLNLHIEEDQTHEIGFGDVLRSFRTTDFSETEMVKGFEEECTVADVQESTHSTLLTKALSNKITGQITGGAKSPFYQVSADLGASLEHTVSASLERSLKSTTSVSKRVKRSFSLSQKIKPGAKELHFAVTGYRKYEQKVFLHYIDYLFVEYKRTALGLRKKKINLPRPEGRNHINRILINLPLFKLGYWKLESESSLLFTETEYNSLPKLEHPDRVSFEPLHEMIRRPLPSNPDRPTLYTLSNIAFPLRWVDRTGPWTKEELEKIEMDEVVGSAWWRLYGPGRKGPNT
jgi:hypothetical protein